MNDLLSTRKYKDERPLNTINKIRNILNDLGILVTETGWYNSAKGFYSVNLMIQNTNMGTNGKGTSYEFALASGYAELMERLQNQAFFRLNCDLSQEALKYKGFYYAPDEKQLSFYDLLKSEDDWFKIQMSGLKPNINKKDLFKKWKGISYEETPSDFIGLPYFNFTTKRISHIPVKMVSKMYMSNGMCAGNTPQEALVQGISEIMERYVNKTIINEKITPPAIPRECIENYPKIDSMITQIETSGNFEVLIKDCSLGQGFPVIGVIFLNRDDQTYFVKFGAHPIFEIAVERTLTELLQGQDVRRMLGVKEFSYNNDIKDMATNLMGILVNGSGYYPTELFSSKFSYEFKEFEDTRQLNNREMLAYLIDLLEKKGYNIFIRNVSYLGFPSYHIIVPGLSEIEQIDDLVALESYIDYNRVKRFIRSPENITSKETDEIIRFMDRANYRSGASVTQFLNLPVKGPFPWYYMSVDLFITALYCKQGNFEKAYDFFNKYMKNIQPAANNKSLFTYYKCVRDYLGARAGNQTEEEILTVLTMFYPPGIIQGTLTEFKNPNEIFRLFGKTNCWNCDNCVLRTQCQYESVEQIYKTLKDKYFLGKISQSENSKILDV